MLIRLSYLSLLILSIPAIFWNYIVITGATPGDTFNVWFSLGGVSGVILAVIALYGLITGKPFTKLPMAVKALTVCIAMATGFMAAIFLLFVFAVSNWH